MNLFTAAEAAANYSTAGAGKTKLPIPKMMLLAILAGILIAFPGAVTNMATYALDNNSTVRMISGLLFAFGLGMVILSGAELFTGNTLISISVLDRKAKVSGMLRNWVFVYIGNFIGAMIVGAIVIFGHQASLFSNGMAASVISTAVTKCTMPFGDALLKGIACNFLVCIAVWIAFAAKDVVGKIVGLFFPIMLFVLCGFEHSVANMYFISAGLFAKSNAAYLQAAADAGIDTSALTWGSFFGKNLLPVTIGNIIGGAICVGCVYWFVYVRKNKKEQ